MKIRVIVLNCRRFIDRFKSNKTISNIFFSRSMWVVNSRRVSKACKTYFSCLFLLNFRHGLKNRGAARMKLFACYLTPIPQKFEFQLISRLADRLSRPILFLSWFLYSVTFLPVILRPYRKNLNFSRLADLTYFIHYKYILIIRKLILLYYKFCMTH